MIIKCPKNSSKIEFAPETKYDNFVLGRLKGRLEKTGVPCELMFELNLNNNEKKSPQDLKSLKFTKDELMTLLIG